MEWGVADEVFGMVLADESRHVDIYIRLLDHLDGYIGEFPETTILWRCACAEDAAARGIADGVLDAGATRILIDNADEYILRKFQGLNERTCLNQKPIIKKGQRVGLFYASANHDTEVFTDPERFDVIVASFNDSALAAFRRAASSR